MTVETKAHLAHRGLRRPQLGAAVLGRDAAHGQRKVVRLVLLLEQHIVPSERGQVPLQAADLGDARAAVDGGRARRLGGRVVRRLVRTLRRIVLLRGSGQEKSDASWENREELAKWQLRVKHSWASGKRRQNHTHKNVR